MTAASGAAVELERHAGPTGRSRDGREAGRDARRLRADPRADDPVPGPQHRLGAVRGVRQPLEVERPERRRSSSAGSRTTRTSSPTRLLEGRPEHRLLRADLGPADDGDRPVPGRDRQPEAARPGVLPVRLLLPVDRELRRDHDPVDLHHVARGPVQQRAGGDRDQPAVRAAWASGRTRTGSATSGPPSTR